MMEVFLDAESGFIAAYRKHATDGSFHIETGYITCPNLSGKVLIICDPMLATGESFETALNALKGFGQPKAIHLASVIASEEGVERIGQLKMENLHLWVAAVDASLSVEKYIVPGLGDAGDLAFGPKLQR